jgi:hypothetical protein
MLGSGTSFPMIFVSNRSRYTIESAISSFSTA